MVVQSAGERYTHFSFGIVDALGQTHSDVAFCCGMVWEWWLTSNYAYNPGATQHDLGYIGNEGHINTYVPSGVLPSGYPSAGVYNESSITLTLTRGNSASVHYDAQPGKINDFFLATENQLTTGGTALVALPWFFLEGGSPNSHVYLGNLPGIRLINMSSYAPAEEITQGSDTWTVFPWKRKGLRSDTGISPESGHPVNTIEYGFAYKKNT
jgi:hypothetical protein